MPYYYPTSHDNCDDCKHFAGIHSRMQIIEITYFYSNNSFLKVFDRQIMTYIVPNGHLKYCPAAR